MIHKEKRMRFAFILAAIGLLGGCETVEKVKGVFADPIILPCPENKILADAAEVVRYIKGDGRDLTDVDNEGKIVNVGLACTTRIDKETRVGLMEVEVSFYFEATRGPANRNRKAQYPYFISVTDLNRKVLYREQFNIAVDFSNNRSKLNFRSDPITIELPLRPELTNKNYLVYGGYVLTREQLQHNRLRRRQRGR